jgi:hypothetical protein
MAPRSSIEKIVLHGSALRSIVSPLVASATALRRLPVPPSLQLPTAAIAAVEVRAVIAAAAPSASAAANAELLFPPLPSIACRIAGLRLFNAARASAPVRDPGLRARLKDARTPQFRHR